MNRLLDFSSRFRILKGGKISLVVSALLGSAVIASAAPSGGTVTSGNANISQSGNVININQSSQKASINWNDFSVKANETVNFNQPNTNSITLNRVVGTEKSVIDGALNANGQVWLLNSNGILFGKNASVNTAGLLATTAELSDTDFQNGNYEFKNSSSNSVINLGTIKVQNSSYVILAGKEVENGGNIEAVLGKVHLVGADSYSINLNGNSLVNLRVNKGVLDALVTNSGNVLANGGEIFLTTNAVDELLKGVVNNTGIIEANSIDGLTGKVEVFAHGGEVQVGGSISAVDGFVETSGKDFTILEDATIKASEWLIDPVDITIDNTLATIIETALASGDVTIETTTPSITDGIIPTENQTSSDGDTTDGDIYVNSAISWDTDKTLTLNADDSIYVNASITASNAAGKLALFYGQGTLNADNTSNYYIKAPINLKAGDNFFTKLGSDGTLTTWKVITDLGSAGSTTGTDLQGINGNLEGNYVLGANIDASATSSWNSGEGWYPLGNDTTKFTGNFDGLGHTIDALTFNYGNSDLYYEGFFGYTDGAIVSNIGLTNMSFFFTPKDLVIESSIGGLIGISSNSIVNNTYTKGRMDTLSINEGGLIGWNTSTSIVNNSYSNIKVIGSIGSGGLVGLNNGTINNSYSTGTVISNGNSNVGGLVGFNSGTINNSYSTGDVFLNEGWISISAIGGLVGTNTGTINNSYSISKNTNDTHIYSGGLVGTNTGTINNSFFDIALVHSNWDSEYGKTTDELQRADTFSTWDNTIWSFPKSGELIEGYEEVKYYPFLKDVTTQADKPNVVSTILFEAGFGTEAAPYEITNWNQLQNINNYNILNKELYFTLVNNLTSSTEGYTTQVKDGTTLANNNTGWKPIGYDEDNNYFIGNFNGNDKTIDSLIINDTNSLNYAGLFGTVKKTTISNLGLTNLSILATKDSAKVGGLIGVNEGGIVTNSYSTGSVTGGDSAYVGGLIGKNKGSIVTNSYSTGSVTGGYGAAVGGLLGENGSLLNSSYIVGYLGTFGKNATKKFKDSLSFISQVPF